MFNEKDLLDFLEEKNILLKTFLRISEESRIVLESGTIEHLYNFQKKREQLIKEISFSDQQIDIISSKLLDETHLLSPHSKTRLNFNLLERKKIIEGILHIDLQILKLIDKIKDDTIRQLRGIKQNQKVIKGYFDASVKKTEFSDIA